MPDTPRKYDPLTPRQSEALGIIMAHIRDHGFPPSLREMGDQMGIASTNGVSDHLRVLERKGYIELQRGKSRAIKVLWEQDDGKLPSDEPPELPPEVTSGHMSRAAVMLLRGDRMVIQRLVAEALAARDHE